METNWILWLPKTQPLNGVQRSSTQQTNFVFWVKSHFKGFPYVVMSYSICCGALSGFLNPLGLGVMQVSTLF